MGLCDQARVLDVPSVAVDMNGVDERLQQAPERRELVLRRYAKSGWLIIAVGVLIPVLAAAGAYRGWRLIRWGRVDVGGPLLAVGLLVFVVRFAFWAHTGFRAAW